MDIPQIRKLKPKLKKFLKRFDHCFPRKDTRAHLPTYISGQLSDIPEKSAEPIAINAGALQISRCDLCRLRPCGRSPNGGPRRVSFGVS